MSNTGLEKTHKLVVWVLLLGDELSLNTGKRKWNYVKWDKPTIKKGERFPKFDISRSVLKTQIFINRHLMVYEHERFLRDCIVCLIDVHPTHLLKKMYLITTLFSLVYFFGYLHWTHSKFFLFCMSSINDLTENKDRCGQ